MALNCIYHPTFGMKVVEDGEKEELVKNGGWFDHPTKAEAEKVRKEHDKRLHDASGERKRYSKPSSSDGRISA